MPARVLVVDDSKFTRTVVRKHLLTLDDTLLIEEAGDGEEALARCASESWDLLTVDIHMPKLDGIALAEQLAQRGMASRMTILSANIQDVVRRRVADLGVDFVAKPVTLEKVEAILKRNRERHAG